MAKLLKADLDGLAEAAAAIANGGLICYPTDTVYGLGCDPLNEQAVHRTIVAKGREKKPMPILVKDLATAEKLAYISNRARKLAQDFWPGPLTILLKARELLPPPLVSEGKVGIRSPNHAICLNLLALCSGQLVGTSANPAGRPPATSAEEVLKTLGGRVDVVLDGGRAPLGVASTVVDLTKSRPETVREGPLSKEEILHSLRRRNPR